VNCHPFIEAEKTQQRNVKRAYGLLKVSRAAYYAARGDSPCERDRADAELTARVKPVRKQSRGYGARGSAPGYAARAGGIPGSGSPG
jgi:hypothetical protein